jgi:acetyltransferase-like isoleucine patch superfamily enzyme
MTNLILYIYLKFEKLYWKLTKNEFAEVGENIVLPIIRTVKGGKYIKLGSNLYASFRFRIEAIDEYCGIKYTPQIIIGNNVTFNTDIHIGCINRIEIQDNVMFGSRVFITDHQHGDTSVASLQIAPYKRPLKSKGSVLIKKNVWIGEGVCILPGVTIGENSIIGSNAVVTKSIPANSVAIGIPAKIIKTIN